MMDITVEEWDRTMAVNIRGVWFSAKAAIPAMQTRGGGSIINIASNRAITGVPMMLHYDASKGAVLAMTRAMAAETGEKNIRVNAVAPGLTMSEQVLKREGIAERNNSIMNKRPLKRTQNPEDLIGSVVFLASDASEFITGQTIIVDGGSVMR
jgi:NAD(P)-dependent dehydrogenase (short-subunit alcohol dehydrogenase family)